MDRAAPFVKKAHAALEAALDAELATAEAAAKKAF